MAKKTRKFSEFVVGNNIVVGDETVGLRNQANTIFDGTSAGGNITHTVTQNNHGFVIGDWLRYDGAAYVKAQANTSGNAESIGMVTAKTTNTFTLTEAGWTDVLGAAVYAPLTAGSVYFLSHTTSGEASLTEPSGINEVSKPVLIATGTDEGWIMPYRGEILNGGVSPTAGTGDGPTLTVNQVGHGFIAGTVIRVSGVNQYTKALSDSFANTNAIGVVVEKIDNDNFVVQSNGYTTKLSGLVQNTLYYLSDSTLGGVTAIKPTDYNSFDKPILYATDTGNAWILEQRPKQIADSNPSVQIINQNNHGFNVEDFVRTSFAAEAPQTPYIKAQANTLPNSRAVGMVVDRIDANNFALQNQGFFKGFTTVLVPGTQYYLDDLAAGILKPAGAEPANAGTVSKPLISAVATDEAWILNHRPMLQPNANGGAGGGASTLIGSHVIVGGEVNIDFDNIFLANHTKITFVLSGVQLSSLSHVQMFYGTGAGPVVYETTQYRIMASKDTGQLSGGTTTNIPLTMVQFRTYATSVDANICGYITDPMSPRNTNGYAEITFLDGGDSQYKATAIGFLRLNTTPVTSLRFTAPGITWVNGKIFIYAQTS